jgi:hypothetical protein
MFVIRGNIRGGLRVRIGYIRRLLSEYLAPGDHFTTGCNPHHKRDLPEQPGWPREESNVRTRIQSLSAETSICRGKLDTKRGGGGEGRRDSKRLEDIEATRGPTP